MQPGDHIELDITSVAHGGVFVGRHEGRVVFVPDAIPGERVRVQLTQTGEKSFWRGETVEVMDASAHRRPHVWRQADVEVPPERRPGGADFGHIALDHQRALKLEVLQDALQRMGGVDLPVRMVTIDGDDGSRWRTRVSLHVDDEGRVGPYAARSHRVIEVDDLPLATEAIARTAADVAPEAPGRIDLVEPADGRVRVLARPRHDKRVGKHDKGDEKRHRGPGATRRAAPAKRRNPAREVVVERVGSREFLVDAGGFWQVHRGAAAALTDLVRQTLPALDPDALHLDLYGGVGLFAATLGEAGASRIVSVESDARATEHAGENLAEWVGARAETGRVDRWLPQFREQAGERDLARLRSGVVVLDPPRSGAGGDVVRELVTLGPASIVYVACDPVALARDLTTFGEGGYAPASVTAVDLFPNSHHVEAVTLLTRV
ncbi:class I SAM-dependent RNA methyltransferase [Microbacterium horticulturae]|uniref:Class I SAM-dependent RNA methyltransferase n=1 Tax=Microbacterium horticulturae TaxID=3028316 RepID=A0ABY8BXS7_9MICO|nr:TRAM domain-containing protein [Microbacterium sp. KACC 23027]WEG07927.1 class I SAM-dependent RNA methyltransferase [Microbacterium sp. KACC 23027]